MFELWAGVCAFASRNPSTREISHSPLNAVQPTTTHAVFPSYKSFAASVRSLSLSLAEIKTIACT